MKFRGKFDFGQHLRFRGSRYFLLLYVRGRTWFLVVNDVMTQKVILVIFRENDYFTLPVVAPSPMCCVRKVGFGKVG